jgi:hypothetical protein
MTVKPADLRNNGKVPLKREDGIKWQMLRKQNAARAKLAHEAKLRRVA